MKIAMLILGIIGALSALGGSVMTLIAGFAGTAAGSLAEKTDVAIEGARVFWAGAFTVAIGGFALVTSIIGGVAKSRNIILTMGISTLFSGILNVYLFNWISGGLLTIAGLLGLIGSKEGTDKEVSIFKSGIFYLFTVCVIIFTGLALLLRSHSVPKSENINNIDTTKPVPVETIPTRSMGPEVLNGKWSGWGGNSCENPLVFNGSQVAFADNSFENIDISSKSATDILISTKDSKFTLDFQINVLSKDLMNISSSDSGDNFRLSRCL